MAGTVREVMQPDPVTLDVAATIEDAAQAMRDHGIGDVIVTDSGQITGILTDRDIVVRGVAEHRHPTATKLGDCCTSEVQVVEADDSVDQAIGLMRQHALRRLPVVEGGRLVGIVSLGDLALTETPRTALAGISAAAPNL